MSGSLKGHSFAATDEPWGHCLWFRLPTTLIFEEKKIHPTTLMFEEKKIQNTNISD